MSKQFTVIGIDPSITSLGIVVLNQEGELVYFSKITSVLPKTYLEDRLIDIDESVTKVVTEFQPTAVGIEGLSYGSVSSSTRDLAQLYGVLSTRIRRDFDIYAKVYAPTSVKKFATGSGKADKKDMFNILPADLQELFSSKYKKTTGLYDITDAYHIAQITLKDIKGV